MENTTLKPIIKFNATEISPSAVQKKAEAKYGDYYCAESVVATICEEFKVDIPKEVIALSSGMAAGAGASGCMCGALNGGLMSLGMFFGRMDGNGPADPVVNNAIRLAHELHDWFRDENGKNAVCCRVLTKGMDMGKGEHFAQCVRFTGLCTYKVAEMLCRELGIKNLDEE